MGEPLKYILDTSCITQAFRTYYSFDIAPSFWKFLNNQFEKGIITTNDKVFEELKRGKDELYEWAKANVKEKMLMTNNDSEILKHYAHLMQWSDNQTGYNRSARNLFAEFENADAWVISCAMKDSLIVVSQEVSASTSKTVIKIPDVCAAFSIKHIDIFKFLKEIGFQM